MTLDRGVMKRVVWVVTASAIGIPLMFWCIVAEGTGQRALAALAIFSATEGRWRRWKIGDG